MFECFIVAAKETLEVLYYENFDLDTVVSSVNVNALKQLLEETNYDKNKTKWLVESFQNGFNLGYQGRTDIQRKAPNLKLRIGSPTVLWNKVMKEVKLKRFAGPFKDPLFKHFVQSPIGLVPKDGGINTRLIFHLSYPRDGDLINSCTPAELCKVKYPDFDEAVKRCMEEFERLSQFEVLDRIFLGKSDFTSAFRNLGMRVLDFSVLLMKAKDPRDGETHYFIDKCLPFGASISCVHFQAVSNGVAHIVQVKIGRRVINYLDDYLFVSLLKVWCDRQMKVFMEICKTINFPMSIEKTFWSKPGWSF